MKTNNGNGDRPPAPMTWAGTGEPTLHEVMDDPVVRLVLHRDGLAPDSVTAFLNACGQGRCPPTPHRRDTTVTE